MGKITVSDYWQDKGFTSEEEVKTYQQDKRKYITLINQRKKGVEQNKEMYIKKVRQLLLNAIGDIEYKNEMADEIINNLFEQFSLRERSKPRRIEVKEIRGE